MASNGSKRRSILNLFSLPPRNSSLNSPSSASSKVSDGSTSPRLNKQPSPLYSASPVSTVASPQGQAFHPELLGNLFHSLSEYTVISKPIVRRGAVLVETDFKRKRKAQGGYSRERSLMVKFVADEEFHSREVKALTVIKHSNVVSLFKWSYKEEGTRHYPYSLTIIELGRESLESYFLPRKASMRLPDRIAMISGIFEGVKACHEKSLVHGSIQPSNIVFFPDEVTWAGGTWKLIDFTQAVHFSVPVVYYNVNFSAPEVVKGLYDVYDGQNSARADPSMDVFSLGQLMAWMFVNTRTVWDKLENQSFENKCAYLIDYDTEFSIDEWENPFGKENATEDVKSMLQSVLKKRARLRPRLDEIMKGPVFAN